MRHFLIWLALACAGVVSAADERLVFADGLARRGLSEQAAAEYEAYLKETQGAKGEELADVYCRLAECYERLGRGVEARGAYRRAASLSTGDRRYAAQLRMAALLLEEGKATEARPTLEALATGRAQAALQEAAKFRLGQCYEALGRARDASTLYRMLAEGTGVYAPHAQVALAGIAAGAGRTAEALKWYRAAMKGESDATRRGALAARALTVAYGAKEYGAAVGFAREAGEKLMGEMQLLLPAAWAALRAGSPEEARGWLAAEEALRPQATVGRLMLAGAIAEALGDGLGAITAYERVLGEFPNAAEAPSAAEAMLVLRAKAGKPEAFLKAYNRVATLLPERVVAQMASLRLDAALQVKDAASAKAAAAWLVEHGEPAVAAEASYRLGWLAQEEKDWSGAGEVWLRTAERWPEAGCAGRAAYAAAYAFVQAKLPDRAEVALRAALASGDEKVVPEALMLKARIALSERDASGASAVLDEYLARYPRGEAATEAAYLRGLIFFNAQDFKAAEQRLGEALAVAEGTGGARPLDHARRVDASMRRAQALHALGRGEEAAALLQPLLGLKDAEGLSPAYLRWLAEFQLERQAWGEAEAAARAMGAHTRASEVDRVLALVLQGRAAEGLGQGATALAAYEQALAGGVKTAYDAEAAYGVARLRLAEGSAQKARAAFSLATERADMGTAEGRALRGRAYAGLAKACEAAGDEAAALRAYMNIIIFYEDAELVPEAFRGAIGILERSGRVKEAETLRAECKQRYGEAKAEAAPAAQ